MKRFFAFSLAEALITLLIVSIIVIATVPVITKKKRNPPSSTATTLWNVDGATQGTVYPSASRDIKLGEINAGSSQGIVVIGTLEFKDQKGKTIGWIKENGENSFSNSLEIIQKQEEIIQMLNSLTTNLQNAINYSNSSQNRSPERYENRRSSPLNRTGSANGIDSNISPEQMRQIAEVQKQIEIMMSQKNQ